MKLTPELFEQITGVKESSLEQSLKPKDDLHLAPRLPLAFRTSACRTDGDKFDSPIQIQICDISVTSIGLTHAAKDRLGKTFVIALKPPRNASPIAIHCEMSTFQSVGQTLIRVGATFIRVGTELDLRRCLGLDGAAALAAGNHTSKVPVSGPSNRASATRRVSQPATAPLVAMQAAKPTDGPEPDEVKRIRDAMLS